MISSTDQHFLLNKTTRCPPPVRMAIRKILASDIHIPNRNYFWKFSISSIPSNHKNFVCNQMSRYSVTTTFRCNITLYIIYYIGKKVGTKLKISLLTSILLYRAFLFTSYKLPFSIINFKTSFIQVAHLTFKVEGKPVATKKQFTLGPTFNLVICIICNGHSFSL